MLTSYAQELLDRRLAAGRRAIDNFNTDGEDDDTAAKDLVSDILTALFGPAGKFTPRSDGSTFKEELDDAACDNARAFVLAALDSYFGDAEDYIEKEEKSLALTDVVVVRDPDASNDISVIGGEANVIDIDLGRFDLGNTDEWNEWQESRRLDLELVASDKARWIIADTVRTAADNWGHEVPAWAAVACYVNA